MNARWLLRVQPNQRRRRGEQGRRGEASAVEPQLVRHAQANKAHYGAARGGGVGGKDLQRRGELTRGASVRRLQTDKFSGTYEDICTRGQERQEVGGVSGAAKRPGHVHPLACTRELRRIHPNGGLAVGLCSREAAQQRKQAQ